MRAFVGFGEFGRQIEALLETVEGECDCIRFDDPLVASGDPLARPFADFERDEYRDCDFYVCMGYRHRRTKAEILVRLEALGRRLPSVIHPTSWVSPTARVGPGVFIYPMCVVDKGVVLDAGVVLNNAVTVSHDSIIGSAGYLSPGVTVSGEVRIGECVFVGSGATIANLITIGQNVTVGVGTVVTRDVGSDLSVIGNPMKILDRPLSI